MRAKIAYDGAITYVHGVHNHLPEAGGHGLAVRRARANWLRILSENPRLSPMSTILQERRRYDSQVHVQSLVNLELVIENEHDFFPQIAA